jgi:NADPH:quinone reductase
MRALVNTPGHSSPPVTLQEVAEPQPAPGESVVEVRAFSLNRGELRLLQNRPEGWRPGQDIAGVVVHAASGDGPAVGQRVVGLADQAGWAEKVALPADRLAVLPEGISFEAAATLPVAGLTALRILRFGGSLLGRRVLITGAAGGVGHFAVQLAAASAAEVVAVARSADRAAGVRDLGASAVVTALEELDGFFDLILESVGGQSLAAAITLVAPGGTIVVFGNSSRQPTPISFSEFFGHEGARLQTYFSYASGAAADLDLALLVGLVDRGTLTPRIGLETSWRDLVNVADALRDRRVDGKAVLRVD